MNCIDLPRGMYFWTSAELEKNKNPSQGWTWLSTKKKFKYPPVNSSRIVNLRILKTNKDTKKIIQGKCIVWRAKNLEGLKREMCIRSIKCKNPYFFYCYKKLADSQIPVSTGKYSTI